MENPDKMGYWRWIWMHWLARLRISKEAVCIMSQNQGAADHHDYPDSVEGHPDHFALLTCKWCGKQFHI
jgi:hypothetical protein